MANLEGLLLAKIFVVEMLMKIPCHHISFTGIVMFMIFLLLILTTNKTNLYNLLIQ